MQVMTQSREILQACCAEHVTRYTIGLPFVLDEYMCATNGHLCVRMPLENCDWKADIPMDNRGQLPPIHALRWDIPRGPMIDLPPVPDEPPQTECRSCDGGGYHHCSCGDYHRCEACDGNGTVDGDEPATKVGPVLLGTPYVRLLRSFGVKQISPAIENIHKSPVYFSVGDIEGLLMPVCPKDVGN